MNPYVVAENRRGGYAVARKNSRCLSLPYDDQASRDYFSVITMDAIMSRCHPGSGADRAG
jgi:hypothetical protein